MASDQKTIDLLFESLSMKKQLRTGWLLRRAPNESLADHSFGAAIIALALARMEKLSLEEEAALVRRALLHDLHESRIGDLARIHRKYVAADYARAEKDLLEGTRLEPEMKLLQDEKLSLLCHDADKLDMLLQAVDYHNAGNRNMQEFVDAALEQVKSASGKKLAKLAVAKMKK